MSYIRFTPEHLEWLNESFEEKSPQEILKWCHMTLPNLIQSTSFGITGMVIIDMLHQLNLQVPVLFIDTLHHFEESIQHAQNAQKHYTFELKVYQCKDAKNQEEFEEKHGPELWKLDSEKYDQIVKVEPQKRALRELDVFAWVNGRRRSQGGERSQLPIMEFDVDGRLKINPLANWNYDQVWEYINDHKVPYNPLHDQGYKSIGDKMTTFPVDDDADERSGRWQGSNKTECGIHIQAPSSDSNL